MSTSTHSLQSRISGTTSICLVIGDPIAHTLSPTLHNAAYAACGISDKFVYAACHVLPQHLGEAIRGIRAFGIRGVSVTIPHKLTVLPYLDEIEPLAAKVGAVNTIINSGGKLCGYNTDLTGVLTPLEPLGSLQGKRVALLGAGGSARAAAYAVTSHGAELTIFNRTLANAQALAAEVGAKAADLSMLSLIPGFDIVLNSTSVGMSPHTDASPVPAQYIRAGQIVFDFVYNPLETKLLKQAKERGATVLSGIEMFLYQGAAQFEIYTGQKAPLAVMRETLLKHFARP